VTCTHDIWFQSNFYMLVLWEILSGSYNLSFACYILYSRTIQRDDNWQDKLGWRAFDLYTAQVNILIGISQVSYFHFSSYYNKYHHIRISFSFPILSHVAVNNNHLYLPEIISFSILAYWTFRPISAGMTSLHPYYFSSVTFHSLSHSTAEDVWR
jgi:hypothetical protein